MSELTWGVFKNYSEGSVTREESLLHFYDIGMALQLVECCNFEMRILNNLFKFLFIFLMDNAYQFYSVVTLNYNYHTYPYLSFTMFPCFKNSCK